MKNSNEYLKWYDYAVIDLKTAEIVLKEGIYNQVCFHSQQCIEKLLKAILIKNNKKAPRIHSISELLKLSKKYFKSEGLESSALIIDSYYIPTRYPTAIVGSLERGMPDEEDAKEALEICKNYFELLKNEIMDSN